MSLPTCAQVGKLMHNGRINLGFLYSCLNDKYVSAVTQPFAHFMPQIRISKASSFMAVLYHSATSASRKRSA